MRHKSTPRICFGVCNDSSPIFPHIAMAIPRRASSFAWLFVSTPFIFLFFRVSLAVYTLYASCIAPAREIALNTSCFFLPLVRVKWCALMGPEAVVCWLLFGINPFAEDPPLFDCTSAKLVMQVSRVCFDPTQANRQFTRKGLGYRTLGVVTVGRPLCVTWEGKNWVNSACLFGCVAFVQCRLTVRVPVTVRWPGMAALSSFVLLLLMLFVVI